ncbi:tRNA (adenosine(37)-N6)-threonylcarbamoyltransferase complex dimerization subunit type 1 TsaB, partial [Corynebacterium nasicanis]
MLVLAIDTSTPDLVTGLVDTSSGRAHDRVIPGTRAHNEQLTPTVRALLAEADVTFADLGAIVVGCGPGPFTGLGVGMASAAAFGDALGIPVHGVCSHDAIARRLPPGAALVATDARRREIYWATYAEGERSGGPGVDKPAELVLPHDVALVSVPEHL